MPVRERTSTSIVIILAMGWSGCLENPALRPPTVTEEEPSLVRQAFAFDGALIYGACVGIGSCAGTGVPNPRGQEPGATLEFDHPIASVEATLKWDPLDPTKERLRVVVRATWSENGSNNDVERTVRDVQGPPPLHFVAQADNASSVTISVFDLSVTPGATTLFIQNGQTFRAHGTVRLHVE